MCYFRPNQMCAYMWNWYLLLNARFFVSIFYTINVCSDFLRRFLRFLNSFSCFFFCIFCFFLLFFENSCCWMFPRCFFFSSDWCFLSEFLQMKAKHYETLEIAQGSIVLRALKTNDLAKMTLTKWSERHDESIYSNCTQEICIYLNII